MTVSTVSAGLSGLKAAAELAKSMRDGLKAGTVKPEELPGRLAEIYDYIVDSKAALVEVQDENLALKKEIANFEDHKAFQGSLQFNPNGYYERAVTGGVERYCSACLDKDRLRIRLTGQSAFSCEFHGFRQSAEDEW